MGPGLTVLTILVVVLLLSPSRGSYPGFLELAKQLQTLDHEVGELKIDLPRSEQKLTDKLDVFKTTFKEEMKFLVLPELVEDSVRYAIENLLRDLSFENLINSHVISEIKAMNTRHYEIKRQQQRMSREIFQLRRDNMIYRNQAKKDQGTEVRNIMFKLNESTEIGTKMSLKVKDIESDLASIHDRVEKVSRKILTFGENEFQLKTKIGRINQTSNELGHRMDRLNLTLSTVLNNTHSLEEEEYILGEQMNEFERALDGLNTTIFDLEEGVSRLNYSFIDSASGRGERTSKNRTVEMRSKILTASSKYKVTKLHVLDIKTGDLREQKVHGLSQVTALTFFSAGNAVLLSTAAGIFSLELDGWIKTTLKLNVSSYGMKVDEQRGFLFLTTYQPSFTLSRMNTDGSNFFTILDLTKYHDVPSGIDLDPKTKIIYVAIKKHLLSVSYEATNIKIIHSAYHINGVALDRERDQLFFNIGTYILQRKTFENKRLVIGRVLSGVSGMQYFNDTLYVSLQGRGDIYSINITDFNRSKIAALDTRSVFTLLP